MSGQTIISYIVYYNDKTNGVEVVKSLPYAISPPSGYVAPDLTKARSLTKSDGLGRSEGSVTYSDATTIVLSTSLSYAVAQGVTGLSSENNNAYEQTTTLDAYNHQSISYSDALGRTRFDQLFSGTTSPTGATLPTYQQSFSYDNIDRMTSGPSGSMTYDSNHVHAAITANSFPDQYAAYDAMGLSQRRYQ